MSPAPRWWRILLRLTLALLAIDALLILWAAFAPGGSESMEWTKLGVVIVTAIAGFALIVVLLALGIYSWIRESRTRSSSTPGS